MHAVWHRHYVQMDELLCLLCCELEAAFQTLGPSLFCLVISLPDLCHVSPSVAPAAGYCRWAPISCYSHDIPWMLKSKAVTRANWARRHPVQPARKQGTQIPWLVWATATWNVQKTGQEGRSCKMAVENNTCPMDHPWWGLHHSCTVQVRTCFKGGIAWPWVNTQVTPASSRKAEVSEQLCEPHAGTPHFSTT